MGSKIEKINAEMEPMNWRPGKSDTTGWRNEAEEGEELGNQIQMQNEKQEHKETDERNAKR
jgi:hypothetical protein